MKGLRWILAFLRDPTGALGGSIATIRARLAPSESRIPPGLFHGAMGTAVSTLLSGCSSAPSRNILGSYFPSWMICALIGLAATVAARALLVKAGIDEELPMPIVVYLAFATAFSLAIWLLWLG
jgi:hypothetical protein